MTVRHTHVRRDAWLRKSKRPLASIEARPFPEIRENPSANPCRNRKRETGLPIQTDGGLKTTRQSQATVHPSGKRAGITWPGRVWAGTETLKLKAINMTSGTSKRGFASMDDDKQREIARKGGESVPSQARSFSKDHELAARAGRKGGHESSGNFKNNPQRAAEAGRKGGES